MLLANDQLLLQVLHILLLDNLLLLFILLHISCGLRKIIIDFVGTKTIICIGAECFQLLPSFLECLELCFKCSQLSKSKYSELLSSSTDFF